MIQTLRMLELHAFSNLQNLDEVLKVFRNYEGKSAISNKRKRGSISFPTLPHRMMPATSPMTNIIPIIIIVVVIITIIIWK